MECPKCKSFMEKVTFHGIEVYRCTNCRGIWFDRLEKEALKRLEGSELVDVGDPKVGREYNKIGKIKCPRCKTQMIRMVDAEQPHIRFESCVICDGSFLDAGEFKDYKEETFLDFFKDLLLRFAKAGRGLPLILGENRGTIGENRGK